ncbi:MAG TPA: energy transducer TonB, partial [Methylocella sp.]|nr:energy transducer TonB [Methylocella sp.]
MSPNDPEADMGLLRKFVLRVFYHRDNLCECRLMQLKTSSVASLLGLLLVSAVPLHAQTDGLDAQTNTVEAWKKKIVTQLASKKEFPPGAIGQTGTAKVKFVIDRRGKLISSELVESAGSELLDAAALRMVERAEPFPEPPAE